MGRIEPEGSGGPKRRGIGNEEKASGRPSIYGHKSAVSTGGKASELPQHARTHRHVPQVPERQVLVTFFQEPTPHAPEVIDDIAPQETITTRRSTRLEDYPHRLRPDDQPDELVEFERLYGRRKTICKLFAKRTSYDYHRIEEAVDDAYWVAYRKWNDFEEREVGNRWNWLMKITYSTLSRIQRYENRRPQRVLTDNENQESLENQTDRMLQPEEAAIRTVDRLEVALRGIPHSEVLIAAANGLTYDEIGSVLLVSHTTVGKYIRIGTEHLMKRVGVDPEDSEEVKRRKLGLFLIGGVIEEDVYDAEEPIFTPRIGTNVPVEVQRAGWLAKQTREAHGKLGFQVADPTGLDYPSLYNFENGKRTVLIRRVYKGLLDCGIRPTDHRMEEINTIMQNQNWLHTLSHLRVISGDNFSGNAIKLLRLAEPQYMNPGEFAEKVHISERSINKYEAGKIRPSIPVMNSILENSVLTQLGENNKLLQLYRLFAIEPETSKEHNDPKPMTRREVSTSSFGRLLNYHRRLAGLTLKDLAKKIPYVYTAIANYENDLVTEEESLETMARMVIAGLNLPPATAELFQYKAQNSMQPVSDDLLERVFAEPFLYERDLGQFKQFHSAAVSGEDRRIGSRIRVLREIRGISLAELAEMAGLSGKNALWRIETNRLKTRPDDRSMMGIITALDLDIFADDDQTLSLLFD